MSKAVEAFRTIAEVADDLGVPKHVLRFWEVKFPQIRPMKRGGGRRFYRPEDLALLRGIQALLHAEAYTIKGVQKILREQGVDHVKQFGRDPQSIPAVKGGGKRTRAAAGQAGSSAGDGQPVAAASTTASRTPPRGAGRPAQVRADGPSRQRIAAVIAELEACRALLGGQPRAARGADGASGPARPRAAR